LFPTNKICQKPYVVKHFGAQGRYFLQVTKNQDCFFKSKVIPLRPQKANRLKKLMYKKVDLHSCNCKKINTFAVHFLNLNYNNKLDLCQQFSN